MKKHDFESTSKKNAKEQTPEMAEREQEILMWMGDIRDDFILEAEDYKHYQSDKSVPGYFIVGGTLAAAAAICTAIFFQTGRNRIDHSNVPMQLPYQTEETKDMDEDVLSILYSSGTTSEPKRQRKLSGRQRKRRQKKRRHRQKRQKQRRQKQHHRKQQMRVAGLVIQQTINLWCRQMKVQYLYIMHGMAALKLPLLENC